MLENHENIAKLWNGYLYNKEELSASDVANMMELMKVARRKAGAFNADDYVDGAGYAAVAYECAEGEENKEETAAAISAAEWGYLDPFDPERFRVTEDMLKAMVK
tara:strand:+ start:335 stop:649 length:315 start_codon:yes stop_codon:yes gene_type:complete